MSYTKIYSCTEEIDNILNLKNTSDARDHFSLYFVHRGITFLVHESIFDQFIAKLIAMRIPILDEHISEYTLHIGNTKIPMFLFWLKSLSAEYPLDILNALIIRARVSLIWMNCATLFTPIDEFGLLEQFITEQNLSKSVHNVYVDATFASTGCIIRVVEFNNSVPIEIADEFIRYQKRIQYPAYKSFPYYVTNTFHFQCLDYLKYFDKPFRNPYVITQVLLLLDYHRWMARRGTIVFNMFDVISMKHAIDSGRFEYINCEFLKLLNRMMVKELRPYISCNVFNVTKYMTDNGVYTITTGVYQYLVHEFQQHYDRFIYMNDVSTVHISNIPKTGDMDKFLQHAKSCSVYLKGWVINSSLIQFIQNVIAHRFRVKKIILDTNHRWSYNEYDEATIPSVMDQKLIDSYVALVGNNEFCFVENFLNWLRQSMPSYCKHMTLELLGTPIRYGSILRDLQVHKFMFRNIELNMKILGILGRARWERISFSKCTLENNVDVLLKLEALNNIVTVELQHEEHTFELLFHYIEHNMRVHNSREFVFRNHIVIEPFLLRLKEFKFIVNRDGTKIEAFHYKTRRSYDFYEFIVRDDASRDSFEFYQ